MDAYGKKCSHPKTCISRWLASSDVYLKLINVATDFIFGEGDGHT
jgi:hypothetical protein